MSPWLSELLLSSQSDERLVALVRSGHDRAFTTIVERYGAPLHRFACRAYGPARADDLVQQTFLHALSALRGGTEVAHLRGWLHQILRNAAVRGGRTWDELGADADWDTTVGGESLADTVERRLEARGALVEIARLPPRQRDAFVRTAIQGRSRTEVADALGLSEGAVRQLVHRARATLRTAVTALTPAPLLRWLAGPRSHGSDRLIELTASAGAASAGGGVVKFGALVASGIVATGVLVTPHGDGAAAGGRPAPARAGAASRPTTGAGAALAADDIGDGGARAITVRLGTEHKGAAYGRDDATGRTEGRGSHGTSSGSRADGSSSGSEPGPSGGGPGPSSGSGAGEPGMDSSGGPGSGTGGPGGTSDVARSSSGGPGPGSGPASSDGQTVTLAASAGGSSGSPAADGATTTQTGSRDLSGSGGSTSTQDH